LTKILSTCNYTSNIRKFFKTYFISKFISYSQAVDCLFKNWENLNSGAERSGAERSGAEDSFLCHVIHP